MTVTIESLYDDHSSRVRALALRMTGDPDLADQLTQEVFIRAWRSLPGFRGDSGVGTWLHTIGVRVVVDHVRAEARRNLTHDTVSRDELHAGASPRGPQDDVRIDLEDAIAGLPKGARAVLVLHDVEGFTHEEIAALLEVTVGTTKSQLHRARRLLMEALER